MRLIMNSLEEESESPTVGLSEGNGNTDSAQKQDDLSERNLSPQNLALTFALNIS